MNASAASIVLGFVITFVLNYYFFLLLEGDWTRCDDYRISTMTHVNDVIIYESEAVLLFLKQN